MWTMILTQEFSKNVNYFIVLGNFLAIVLLYEYIKYQGCCKLLLIMMTILTNSYVILLV
jgi:hypothetical protein